MTTLAIDLQKNANQNLQVTLGGNVYRLTLNTRLDELYMSIIKNGEPVIYNRICQNLNPIEALRVLLVRLPSLILQTQKLT